MSLVPPFHGEISFNAQHAPAGAFFSFTCGHFGTRGGFGLQIGKPGNQDLYIGVKDGDRFSDAPLRVLPFYEGAAANEAGGTPDADVINLFNPPSCAPDFTKNLNVTAIVMNVPISMLGGGSIFDTWSSISVPE